MQIPLEARCARGKLHEYMDVIEYGDAFVEVCVRCSGKAIYRKDEHGRIDNRRYLRAHYRSFVQPHGVTGPHFAYVYGEKAWREAVSKPPVRLPVDWDTAGQDALRYLRELRKEKTTV